MKVVVVSGGFDPIHSGHIDYLKSATSLGDIHVVALNSDNWLIKKKKKFLLLFIDIKLITKYTNITFDNKKCTFFLILNKRP